MSDEKTVLARHARTELHQKPTLGFSVVGLFAWPAAAAFALTLIGLGMLFHQGADRILVQAEEGANVRLAGMLANELGDMMAEKSPGVARLFESLSTDPTAAIRLPEFGHLDGQIRRAIHGTSIWKVKIYNDQGLTIYSTDPVQIGLQNPGNAGVLAALGGKPASELVQRDVPSRLEGGGTFKLDLVQSYVPGKLPGDASGKLVFEVYSDVTEQLKTLDKRLLEVLLPLVTGVALLYGFLLILMRRGQRLLGDAITTHEIALARLQSAEIDLARRKTEFVSAAAHELRTPMTAVLGFSELLRTRAMPPERMRELATDISGHAQQMAALLDDLLDLARIAELGEAAVQLQVQALQPLLEAVAGEFRSGHQRDVQLNVVGVLPPVRLDSMRMRQVLVNLLGNACKYSPPDTPVRLDAFHDLARDAVVLRVIDQGVGILPEELPRLGERFWRSPRVGHIKGTGLGLAIVAGFVRLHGGNIDFRSRPGAGTEVCIQLPLAAPEARPATAGSAARTQGDTEKDAAVTAAATSVSDARHG